VSAVLAAREPSARYLEAAQPTLVRQFDLLGSAPGGISRLRELILTLAVQGKLAPQLPGEEPASLLLRQIESEKERLIAAGAMKRPKIKDEIAEDELPFPTPPGWQWVRLGTLLQKIGAGSTPLGGKEVYVPSGVKFLRSQNVWNDGLRLDGVAYISPATHAKMAGTVVTANDLLFNITGASIGRCAAVPADFDEANVSQHVTIIRPVLPALNPFLHTVLISRLVQQAVMEVQVGVSREGLSISKLGNFLVPIPPLQEQARIVARVADLMRLCDALEAKGRLEAEQHARLLGTLLGTLTDSSTPEELAANWQRVADHFDLLLDRPEAVDALEQTILQLAVRGLLVPQNPSDEPAAELMRRIRSYRDEQVKSGLAKRERPFTRLSEADHPFELPTGWEWIRFDDLIEPAKPISYGVLVPGPDVDRGVPFVRIADLSLTDPPVKPEKTISTEVDAQYQRTRLEGGEILMGVVGSIGKLGVAPPSWAGANIARAICRIVPVGLVDYGFVLLLLQSKFMRDSFAGDTRTLAQPTLNVGLIRGSPTPLPPIAEQARIVARVTEIRRICADLSQRLERSGTTQASLADVSIEQAQSA
jgi:type I restriction enzyme S subunit